MAANWTGFDFTSSSFNPDAFRDWIIAQQPVSSTLTDAQKSAITGSKLDDDFSSATIGKDIPVFIGGQALVGCSLAEGPFLTTVDDASLVDYIVTPCVFAVPGATREFSSTRLNGTESFTSADGGATWTDIGTVFDDVEISVRYGTEIQLPFASSIVRYGSRAVPYRSHGLIELKNVPVAPFANLIPFVSVYVYQEEALTSSDAVSRILDYGRFGSAEYEVNVSGEYAFWMLIGEKTVFELFQDLQRSIFRNVNVVATDKLRVFENSSTVTPIDITRDDVAADSIRFWIDPPETMPADLTLGYVDTGRDNAFYSVKASRARYPIPLTSSQRSQKLDLPIGMTEAQAETIAGNAILINEFARHKCAFKLLPHMRGVEPGDIVAPDFAGYPTYRVLSIARNAADWTSDAVCERVELSLLPTGPSITSNGGGSTAAITIDEGTTAVTTVTADQSGTFSIVGGEDSSFFTIHPTTGVLTITARDYEDPQDVGANNTYKVTVQILADGLAGTQAITVTIANIADGGVTGEMFGFPFPITQA